MSNEAVHFKLVVENGEGKMPDRSGMINYIKSLKDGIYYLALKRRTTKRSEAMNRYYFGVVVKILSDHTGYETEEMHEYLKLRFNSTRTYSPTLNRDLPRVSKSTAALDNVAFIEYWSKIQRWAALGGDEDHDENEYALNLGDSIYVPDPNEYGIDTEQIRKDAA